MLVQTWKRWQPYIKQAKPVTLRVVKGTCSRWRMALWVTHITFYIIKILYLFSNPKNWEAATVLYYTFTTTSAASSSSFPSMEAALWRNHTQSFPGGPLYFSFSGRDMRSGPNFLPFLHHSWYWWWQRRFQWWWFTPVGLLHTQRRL